MVHSRQSRRLILALGTTIIALASAACTAEHRSDSSGGGAALPNNSNAGPTHGPDAGTDTDASREPRSTFAIDVDTASYQYARAQLLRGEKPDPSTVRPEEFINAFRQDYPQPSGSGFTVNADGSRLPTGYRQGDSAGEPRLLRIGLQTRAEDPAVRADAALTFVIDTSGSMADPGKLDLVKDALHTLVGQLRPTDAVAIVAFESEARVLREMTDVRRKSELDGSIDELEPGGSTNLEDGLVTGYRVARDGFRKGYTNRVILLSDGLANTGDTAPEPILRQVREAAAKQIALLGVGVGRDYGDALMERLADEGDGFVTYISEQKQARDLFVHRLPATLAVRALDAKVQVTFDTETVSSYRLIGYENRTIAPSDFRDDRVDGGEVGPGHTVTALYLVRLRSTSGRVAEARVRWLDPATREASEKAVTIDAAQLSGAFASASPRLRVSYVAGFFAELLRGGPDAEDITGDRLRDLAQDAYRETDDSQVGELADLISHA